MVFVLALLVIAGTLFYQKEHFDGIFTVLAVKNNFHLLKLTGSTEAAHTEQVITVGNKEGVALASTVVILQLDFLTTGMLNSLVERHHEAELVLQLSAWHQHGFVRLVYNCCRSIQLIVG